MAFYIFFHSWIIRYKFSWVLYIHMRNHYYFDKKHNFYYSCLIFCSQCTLSQKTVRFSDVFMGYRKAALGTNGLSFFSASFLMQALPFHKTAWEGREKSLFLTTISTCSQTFKYSFVVLYLRWLPSANNRSAFNF